MTEEKPRSDQGEIFILQSKNFEIITAQRYDALMRMLEKTVALPIKFKKSAKLALCLI